MPQSEPEIGTPTAQFERTGKRSSQSPERKYSVDIRGSLLLRILSWVFADLERVNCLEKSEFVCAVVPAPSRIEPGSWPTHLSPNCAARGISTDAQASLFHLVARDILSYRPLSTPTMPRTSTRNALLAVAPHELSPAHLTLRHSRGRRREATPPNKLEMGLCIPFRLRL